MKLLKGIIVAALILMAAVLVAQTDEQSVSAADISIRFYNKTIYYPDMAESNPILVRIEIKNTTPQTMHFKLADDRIYSMDFTAVTSRNIPLLPTDTLIKKRSRNKPVFFREITLETGEEYAFTENIKNYVKIDRPGMYIIQGLFYPELNWLEPPAGEKRPVNEDSRVPAVSVTTNKLTLDIRPSPSAAAAKSLTVSPQTQDLLRRVAMPPDQVVEQTIIARQKNNWEAFFLYLDLESMINNDPSRASKFKAESADGRNRMVENYKNDLRAQAVDQEIVTIPNEFQIENTSYSPTEGEVSTLQWFFGQNYKEKKRYLYGLHQKDGIWLIYKYDVTNLGNE